MNYAPNKEGFYINSNYIFDIEEIKDTGGVIETQAGEIGHFLKNNYK